jgi:arginine/ornithine transport system substrate-binding protein
LRARATAPPSRPVGACLEIVMKRLLPWALLLMALAPAAARAADPATLRIGVEGAYPPFSSVGADGKIVGFDIDIANAVCAEMKVACTLVQQDFDGMIPALKARKVDLVVASLSITPERQKVVDFSDKYYKTPNRLIAKAGVTIDGSAASVQGKKIGVQRSTINDRYVTDRFPGATIKRYAKQDEVYLDLAAGRIDATLVDSVAGDVGFLKTPAGKGFAFTGPSYDDPIYFGMGVGIAMRKGETALRERVNGAIKAIRANGAYKKLQDKYFDFDVYGR